ATSGSPAAQARAASCPRSASTCAACRVSRATPRGPGRAASSPRSEEHTSELQSLTNLVCRLLLEKKKSVRLLGAVVGRVGGNRVITGHEQHEEAASILTGLLCGRRVVWHGGDALLADVRLHDDSH